MFFFHGFAALFVLAQENSFLYILISVINVLLLFVGFGAFFVCCTVCSRLFTFVFLAFYL